MQKWISQLFLTSFIFLFSLSCFSWNAVGHMLVANIAYQNLKPNVKNKVDNLVSYIQKEYPNMKSFVYISTWPDAIRSQKIDMFSRWHYIDIPFSDDGTPIKNTIDTDNAVWAVTTMQQVITNNDANNFERARFLAFLVHIVGDLHQPLHAVSRISAQHPDGDQGGNLFHVRYHNQEVKLHHLWDIGVGDFDVDSNMNTINAMTETITAQYPENMFGKKIHDVNPQMWANESLENAKKYVYDTAENQSVTTEYVETGKKFSEQQVALAGYRLANLLNEMLG